MRAWYKRWGWTRLLWPFAKLYELIIWIRRLFYKCGWFKTYRSSLPVIVVGNITVGGTGKTPLVIAIVQWLKSHGHKPAVVSRGYGGQSSIYPLLVDSEISAKQAGDEPVLIAMQTQSPVVVSPKRVEAIQWVENNTDATIIVSDDGLQHLAMGRDLEIIVVDGVRQFGNGLCLPAGPLRESFGRLESVDMVVWHGQELPDEKFSRMELVAGTPYRLNDREITKEIGDFTSVNAVAGIGHPERFFGALMSVGISVVPHVFPDHYQYGIGDFSFASDDVPVLMTEKDAVKCREFYLDNAWVLPVSANLSDDFWSWLVGSLKI